MLGQPRTTQRRARKVASDEVALRGDIVRQVHVGRLGATRRRRATPASGATRAHRLSRHPWLVPLR